MLDLKIIKKFELKISEKIVNFSIHKKDYCELVADISGQISKYCTFCESIEDYDFFGNIFTKFERCICKNHKTPKNIYVLDFKEARALLLTEFRELLN